ncbi:zinc finger protein, putative [Ixodes scapularis]|uniref:Zinc finger protein, putative n=1 Tax=Ixodes scapularis TaxID=6945 RepID=B7PRM0_IXOSC|nr:zinc finger protein, putative [Ixodes scapularis]|eukprot:XP_002400266.1 zinc finger protein, putative [Ixodes scapularis]
MEDGVRKCMLCSYSTKQRGGMAFATKGELGTHIRTHTGDRPYRCHYCPMAFAQRSNMVVHERVHTGERPYKCHSCCKGFATNTHLKAHNRQYHGGSDGPDNSM